MITPLQKMFTVAGDDEDSAPILIFYDSSGISDVRTVAEELCVDPLLNEVFPKGAVIRLGTEVDEEHTVVVSDDLSDEVLPLMGEQHTVLVWEPGKGIEELDTYETYYACKKPARTFLGCVECVSTCEPADPTLCVIAKRVHQTRYTDEDRKLYAQDLTSKLKSRKSVIGAYTYVSPRLTTERRDDEATHGRGYYSRSASFAKMFRPPKRHDFTLVDDNSEIVLKALQERTRRQRFRKSDCASCSALSVCNKGDSSYCQGRYTQSEAEMEQKLIAGTAWAKWTDSQMRTIIQVSGAQHYKHNRCLTWLTFTADGYVALRYARHPYKEPIRVFKTWAEFKPWLMEHYPHHTPSKNRLKVGTRGTLAAIAQIRYSRRLNFGGGNYPVVGIDARHGYDTYDYCFYLVFNNSHGERVTYPSTEACHMVDLYNHQSSIPGISKSVSVNCRQRRGW